MLLAVLQRAHGVVDDPVGRNLKSALAKLTIDSQLPEPLRESVTEQHLLSLERDVRHAAPPSRAARRGGRAPQARRVPLQRRRHAQDREARDQAVRARPRRRQLVPRRLRRGPRRDPQLPPRPHPGPGDAGRAAREAASTRCPADFDIRAHIGVEEFQIDEGSPPVVVTLETDEVVDVAARAPRCAAPGRCARTPTAPGTYEVEVKSEEGLLRWLAEFGGRVRVVAPLRLADAFHQRLEKARALYAVGPFGLTRGAPRRSRRDRRGSSRRPPVRHPPSGSSRSRAGRSTWRFVKRRVAAVIRAPSSRSSMRPAMRSSASAKPIDWRSSFDTPRGSAASRATSSTTPAASIAAVRAAIRRRRSSSDRRRATTIAARRSGPSHWSRCSLASRPVDVDDLERPDHAAHVVLVERPRAIRIGRRETPPECLGTRRRMKGLELGREARRRARARGPRPLRNVPQVERRPADHDRVAPAIARARDRASASSTNRPAEYDSEGATTSSRRWGTSGGAEGFAVRIETPR